jgi:hypothetical protein
LQRLRAVAEVAEAVHGTCLSCGKPQELKFCQHCGEKRINEHDYSILHYGETLLETFTHFDFRSLRALKIIFRRPGGLTRAYLTGQRKALIGPIQLFVIVNVVFAFIGGNAFKTPLRIQEANPPFRHLKQSMAARAIEHSNLTREEFAREFDRNAGTQSKTWIFSMIPVLALCLSALYGFRRYYFEHLVFVTHFYTYMMLFILAASVVVGLGFLLARVNPNGYDFQMSLAGLLGLIVYLYFALQRVYGDGKRAAAVRAIALGACIFPVLLGYRFLLFFVTLYSMH